MLIMGESGPHAIHHASLVGVGGINPEAREERINERVLYPESTL